MTMTNEALTMIEHDAASAPAPILSHYIGVVRNGVQEAPDDVAEHGRHLLLKLEHLLHQQQAEPIDSTATQDALKKASWILAAANAYLGFAKGSLAYMVIVVVGWLVAQTLAVVLLSIEEKEGSQGPEEQQHASTSGIRDKRPQH